MGCHAGDLGDDELFRSWVNVVMSDQAMENGQKSGQIFVVMFCAR